MSYISMLHFHEKIIKILFFIFEFINIILFLKVIENCLKALLLKTLKTYCHLERLAQLVVSRKPTKSIFRLDWKTYQAH